MLNVLQDLKLEDLYVMLLTVRWLHSQELPEASHTIAGMQRCCRPRSKITESHNVAATKRVQALEKVTSRAWLAREQSLTSLSP